VGKGADDLGRDRLIVQATAEDRCWNRGWLTAVPRINKKTRRDGSRRVPVVVLAGPGAESALFARPKRA